MKRTILTALFLLLIILHLSAQEGEEKRNQVNLVFGYTHIPSAYEEGEKEKAVFVPTIGVDYFRELNEKWVVGAVLDLELANYLVKFNREDLERNRALLIGVLAGYELSEHWGVMAGPAIEFEENKNLFVMRLATEYKIDLGESWLLLPALNFDFKEEYVTWGLSVGLGKRF
ncbi:hypothetical protein [Pseudotamlana agarivorans]|uniref:hypothetical protein n=1 Tax=Pseudotamlana agarivorans TaxID=481183 RepID=UPI000831C781|nr:hypothetical protein [Tamlana agarivorans]